MKDKSVYNITQINNHSSDGIQPLYNNVYIRTIYTYDYPDSNNYKRKKKQEKKIKKILDMYPEFKDETEKD